MVKYKYLSMLNFIKIIKKVIISIFIEWRYKKIKLILCLKKKNVKVGMIIIRILSKKMCYFFRENNCNGDINIDLMQYN